MHVAEYCWAAAHAFHPPGSREAETWAAGRLTAVLTGHADRPDITGARWGLDGAEAVLQLRALITNGGFEG